MRGCVRTLVVDDSPEMLEAITGFLKLHPSFAVIGAASSGEEAIRLARESEPDLVLMDTSMPGMSGLAATRALAALPHRPRIILCSLEVANGLLHAAQAAGCDGFCVKDRITTDLMPLLHGLFPHAR